MDTVKAFADDTVIILLEVRKNIKAISALFQEYADISGLALNLPKTVLIPLHCRELK